MRKQILTDNETKTFLMKTFEMQPPGSVAGTEFCP